MWGLGVISMVVTRPLVLCPNNHIKVIHNPCILSIQLLNEVEWLRELVNI